MKAVVRDVMSVCPVWVSQTASVLVKDGVVTLEGTPETASIGHDLVRRAVVPVRDRLVYPVSPVPSRPGPYF